MSAPYELKLTAAEAVLLDGKVNPEAQAVVTRAIEALSLSTLGEKQAAMVARILEVARTKGRLTYSRTNIKHCPCCGRSDGYWPVRRSSRWKRKGQPDYDNPRLFSAWNLDQGFITVQHHIGIGFCAGCAPAIEPVLRDRLASIECDTPAHWTGMAQRFQRHENRVCSECGWMGHEGEMRKLRTIMGDGFYPGGCPNCPATNTLGATKIKPAEGWVLIPVAPKASQTPPEDASEGGSTSRRTTPESPFKGEV